MLPPKFKTQPNCSVFPPAIYAQQSPVLLTKSVPCLQPTFTRRTSGHCLTFRTVNFLSASNNNNNNNNNTTLENCSVPFTTWQNTINNPDLSVHTLAQLVADPTVLKWDSWLHPATWSAANRANAQNVVVKRVYYDGECRQYTTIISLVPDTRHLQQ